MWQHAHAQGRVEVAAVRASDFYGPGVENAALGDISFGRLARGASARVVGDPDQPHSFTYVPDVARALVSVAEADDAMGQAWNVPNAPDRPRLPPNPPMRKWLRGKASAWKDPSFL